jgi:DNA-binding IclR family transcriptional regulator
MSSGMRAAEDLQRIRGLFIEVPGTHLTSEEAARLAGVELHRCDALLTALVDAGLLTRSGKGRYRLAE